MPQTATSRYLIPRPHGAAKRWGRPAGVIARHAVRVEQVVRETADAVTLVLELADGRPLPFRAGQYLTHCFEIGGDTVKRAYSLSAAEGGRLACTIKAVAGGVVSRFAQGIAPGYAYTVMGPSGDFVLPADAAAPLAFLAAGSGITPVIGLIETALARVPQRRVRLVYGSRDERSIIFRERLERLTAAHANLSVVHVLSQTSGRLTGARAAQLLGADAATHVFLCGPAELMDATLAALPLPAAQIHHERFFAAPRHGKVTPLAAQPIEFRKSGRKVTQRPGETVLDAGLREGVALQFSCTVGGCAACKVRVVEGQVALDEPNCLSAEERAQGYTLSCSARALGPAVIDA